MFKEGIVVYVGVVDFFFKVFVLMRFNFVVCLFEDYYGVIVIVVEFVVLGVRGLIFYRGILVYCFCVEFEFNGVMFLYFGLCVYFVWIC